MRRTDKTYKKNTYMRHARIAVFIALCSLWIGDSEVMAQTPNQVGALPYVVIVMDTSGSTEYNNKGLNEYPKRAGQGFKAGGQMNLINPSTNQIDVGSATGANAYLGPCAIWEPPTCNQYERPTRYYGNSVPYGPQIDGVSPGPAWGDMSARMKHVVDNLDYRLHDDQQPKHITFKEILTGDMILAPDSTSDPDTLNASDYGPGCWFIPRQKGSLAYPEMANYCATQGPFANYDDVWEPVPHLQEVYNHQKKNGLLDNLARTAIFAFAGLDGFREPGKFNDPYTYFPNAYYPAGRSQFREDGACTGGVPCVNLGVTRVVGPKLLNGITFSELSSASEYTQQVINNTGYMHSPGGAAPKLQISSSHSGGYSFQPSDRRFLEDFNLGRQPIARATPLAAAIYDVNNFFALGLANPGGDNPLSKKNDGFTECRDRHVIILSDGSPAPERPSPKIQSTVGSAQLDAAFGYDPNLFPYDTSEEEISYLHQFKPPMGNNVRTHVVALLDELPPTPTVQQIAERAERLRKLDAMAAAGGTCASESLNNDEWVSKTSDPKQCRRNGGVAANLGRACLDTSDRQYTGAAPAYTYTDANGNTTPCKFPALVMTQNNRADIEAALAETMNNIIQSAGVKSRTKTVYSNDLESILTCAGVSTKARGVNEYLSGAKIGGGPSWTGLLYRNTYSCGCNPGLTCSAGSPAAPTFTDFSEQISKQVRKVGTTYSDNRRVFTSMLDPSMYDYTITGTGNSYRDISNTEPHRFFSPWPIYLTPNSFNGSPFGRYPRPSNDSFSGESGSSQVELEHKFLANTGLFGSTGQPQTRQNIAKFLGLQQNSSNGEIDDVFNRLRGRSDDKLDRTLGGIYNGNPAVLDPPSLDLPIESYRAFKAKNSNRPPIVFVPTIDGQLHAIYGGDGLVPAGNPPTPKGTIIHRAFREASGSIVNRTTAKPVDDGGVFQREAWSYIPFFLLPHIASSQMSNAYLMDGTPTVKDVRLCHFNQIYNQNHAVCGTQNVQPQDQWRTVLVQGLGLAGKGYYAIDVTYQGGNTDFQALDHFHIPDPIPMWEFPPASERTQAKFLYNKNKGGLIGSTSTPCTGVSASNTWNRSLMGNSISEPEIGTVLIEVPGGNARLQRPIVLFGGGEPDPSSVPVCSGDAGNLSGKAIYVLDLQTGSMIRRFVNYYNKQKQVVNFDAPITGSPALYSSFTGAVATRGFIGDAKGRLYKIDFTDPDPESWAVYLFFDPADAVGWLQSVSSGGVVGTIFGAANYKPAISKLPDENLLVVYGLGEAGDDLALYKTRAIFGLRDRVGVDPSSSDIPVKGTNNPITNDRLWAVLFEEDEKITGEPFIFDNVTFYPTYRVSDPANLCLAGEPRINRVNNGKVEVTTFDQTSEKTIIRGLSVRMNPCCAGGLTPPELVAQTGGSDLTQSSGGGGAPPGGGPGSGGSGSGGAIVGGAVRTGELSTFRQTIRNPTSQAIPLSWSRVIN